MTGTPDGLRAMWHGIDLCRQGDWQQGLEILHRFAAQGGSRRELPGRFYSYLGYGIARYERCYKEGVALCRRAVEIEPDEVENYLNLARLYDYRGNRKGAWKSVLRGLEINPRHRDLNRFLIELDRRRQPVLSFLARRHPLNRRLGRWRYRLLRRR